MVVKKLENECYHKPVREDLTLLKFSTFATITFIHELLIENCYSVNFC